MKNFKKDYFLIGHEITLFKKDCPIIPQKREHISKIPYASAVRSIMYAMTYTKLDVAYSLGIMNRYQSDLDKNYWKVAKAIIKYLKNTKD